MTYAVHKTTPWTIQKGLKGWPVFALQRALNEADPKGVQLVEDFDFGPVTESGVKRFQSSAVLTQDGKAGPKTQEAIIQINIAVVDELKQVPAGMLRSICLGESGNYIAAVAWGSPGGVDVGAVQRRVYESQFNNQEVIKAAFDTGYQLGFVADTLAYLFGVFRARPKVSSDSLAWRLAVLNHNYPVLADRVSRYGIAGLSSYFTSPQSWVTNINAKFPDGTPIRTPLQWGQKYSLGNSAHGEPGTMVRFVKTWSAV